MKNTALQATEESLTVDPAEDLENLLLVKDFWDELGSKKLSFMQDLQGLQSFIRRHGEALRSKSGMIKTSYGNLLHRERFISATLEIIRESK